MPVRHDKKEIEKDFVVSVGKETFKYRDRTLVRNQFTNTYRELNQRQTCRRSSKFLAAMLDISDVLAENRRIVADPNGGTSLYLSEIGMSALGYRRIQI
jgi:hypothetical protein